MSDEERYSEICRPAIDTLKEEVGKLFKMVRELDTKLFRSNGEKGLATRVSDLEVSVRAIQESATQIERNTKNGAMIGFGSFKVKADNAKSVMAIMIVALLCWLIVRVHSDTPKLEMKLTHLEQAVSQFERSVRRTNTVPVRVP